MRMLAVLYYGIVVGIIVAKEERPHVVYFYSLRPPRPLPAKPRIPLLIDFINVAHTSSLLELAVLLYYSWPLSHVP